MVLMKGIGACESRSRLTLPAVLVLLGFAVLLGLVVEKGVAGMPSDINCPLHLASAHDDLYTFMRPNKCARISDEEEDPGCRCLSVAERILWPHDYGTILQLVGNEQHPLHIPRNDTEYFGQLFTSSDFFRFFTFYRFKYGEGFKLVRDGKMAYETNQPVQLDEVLDSIARNGSTAVMTSVHGYHENIRALSWSLESALSLFSSTNIYLTPAHSRGFDFHQDVHAVFILQLEGVKHWRLYTPSESRGFPWYPGKEPEEIAKLRFFSEGDMVGLKEHRVTMRPGDTLVIPRGVIHAAETVDEHSLHLTVSLDDMMGTYADAFMHSLTVFRRFDKLSQSSTRSLKRHIKEAGKQLTILRQPVLISMDANAHVGEETLKLLKAKWEAAVEALAQYCKSHHQCGASKQALRRLESDTGMEYGLQLLKMMQCGGHLKSLPDMGSLGRVRSLTPETRVFRRPGVLICAFENLVSDEDEAVAPRILGINRKWTMDMRDSQWKLAKAMQSVPVGEPLPVSKLPGKDPVYTAQMYISYGVLAVAGNHE